MWPQSLKNYWPTKQTTAKYIASNRFQSIRPPSEYRRSYLQPPRCPNRYIPIQIHTMQLTPASLKRLKKQIRKHFSERAQRARLQLKSIPRAIQTPTSQPITKTLFQTSKAPQPPAVETMIRKHLPCDWQYRHFTDSQIIEFFNTHPLKGFENIIEKFNSFKSGAHKSDLFRYFYLYQKGGFFLDSDAMFYCDLNAITQQRSFISVNSTAIPNTLFQGILAAAPKHPILYLALKDAYEIPPYELQKNYHRLCHNLHQIVFQNGLDRSNTIEILNEQRLEGTYVDSILDRNSKVLFKHYWRDKVIPTDAS